MAVNYIGKQALTQIFTLIKTYVKDGFVAKDGAKVLSDNNYTTAEKNKLQGIAAGAQVNVIEEVKVNGVKVNPTEKSVDVKVPTKVSELTNDSNFLTSIPAEYVTDTELTAKGYQTAVQVNSIVDGKGFLTAVPEEYVTDNELNAKNYQNADQVSQAIADAVGKVTGFEFSVVESLPQTGAKGIIYLVAHAHGAQDSYDEFIWVTDKFEKIGNTDIDLSGYLKKTDLVELTNEEIEQLWAAVK